MAKRRSAQTRTITKVVRAPAPVIRVSAPRAVTHKKQHRRRSGGAGSFQKTVVGSAIGGAAYGFLEKSFPNLPTIPLLGRAGTIAVVGYFAVKKGMGGGLVRDVVVASAVIAGYQLGSTGHVSGHLAPQVSGVAAQV